MNVRPGVTMCEEIKNRLVKINRTGGNDSLTGVFYSLQEHRISVGKATEVVRHFLETGVLDKFEPPQGRDECEEREIDLRLEITNYRAALRKIEEHIRAGNTPRAIALIHHWHVNTPEPDEVLPSD